MPSAVTVVGAGGIRPYDAFPVLVGPIPLVVTEVRGDADDVARAVGGLPAGPATAEAVAVRLRRCGAVLDATAGPVRPPAATVRAERRRGAAAVEVWRAAPDLLAEVQLGSWASGRSTARLLRTLLLPVAPLLPLLARRPLPPAGHRALLDAAFWSGARSAASSAEWRVLTTSYVSYCYHRVAGEHRPGQERLDLSPSRLRTQLRALRLLGFRPLPVDELLALHEQQRAPRRRRRRYVLSFDDGFTDALDAAQEHLASLPHLYVPTGALGGTAHWAQDSPVAGWDRVRELRALGAPVGGHGRTHLPMAGLTDDVLADEIAGSFADLHRELPGALPVLAYPNGRHDLRARDAARRAGYRLAWTTDVGRNGAGTDRWCLRRIGVAEFDSLASFLYRTVTGELLPARWERRLLARHERRTGRPAKPVEGVA